MCNLFSAVVTESDIWHTWDQSHSTIVRYVPIHVLDQERMYIECDPHDNFEIRIEAVESASGDRVTVGGSKALTVPGWVTEEYKQRIIDLAVRCASIVHGLYDTNANLRAAAAANLRADQEAAGAALERLAAETAAILTTSNQPESELLSAFAKAARIREECHAKTANTFRRLRRALTCAERNAREAYEKQPGYVGPHFEPEEGIG